MSFRSVLVILGIPVAFAFPSTAAAGEVSAFTAFSARPAEVIVSHREGDYLGFSVIAWGPKWAWAGIEGAAKSDQGAATAALTAKIGGAAAPVRIDFRAARPGPKQIELDYRLRAEAATDLTCLVVEMTPGKTFEGRDVFVQSQGRETPVRCPFGRRGLGTRVDAVRMIDGRGAVTVVRFDPPCEITSDGAARIVLAKGKLPEGAVRRLSITLELPAATDFFPSAAEMPDEPGLDDWYPWRAAGDTGPSAIGMEDWLDRPAGKHGRIERRGDALIYNSRPIKLWGLNLCYGACAPEKPLADKRASSSTRIATRA